MRLNIASTLGLIAFPRMPAYCASKGGVVALTRQLALDYARQNIRVNCICPGPTLTPRIRRYLDSGQANAGDILKGVPMGRFAEPEEIAATVLFLASDEGLVHHRLRAGRGRRPDSALSRGSGASAPERRAYRSSG